jgi:succinate dehydrogenase / fumarate reductase membrane anchor subunit
MVEMEIKSDLSKKPLGSLSRILQATSGLFLIFFVGIHLYVAHIDFGHPIQFFAQVIQNMHNPLWLTFFIAFVWVISYHAVNGLGAIIKDITMTRRAKSYVNVFLLVLFILTGIYGTILAILVSGIY